MPYFRFLKGLENTHLKHPLSVSQIVPICSLKIVTRELQNAIVSASKEPLRGLALGGSRAGSTAMVVSISQ